MYKMASGDQTILRTSGAALSPLLEKMRSPDADIRYMAANDLRNTLTSDDLSSATISRDLIDAILLLLRDKNAEVQNQAIKLLSIIVPVMRDELVHALMEGLVRLLQKMSETDSTMYEDVAVIAIKSVVGTLQRRVTLRTALFESWSPTLLGRSPPSLEVLQVLSEWVNELGSSDEKVWIDENVLLLYHRKLFPLMLDHGSRLQSRVASILAGLTAVSGAQGEYFKIVMCGLMSDPFFVPVLQGKDEGKYEKSRVWMYYLRAIAQNALHRVSPHLDKLLPVVLTYLDKDWEREGAEPMRFAFEGENGTIVESNEPLDDLRELCFQTLEHFAQYLHTMIDKYLPAMWRLAIAYIRYDPHYIDQQDGDEGGDRVEGDRDGLEEEEEFDEVEDEDDDSDLTWKVRRCAARCLRVLINHHRGFTPGLTVHALLQRFSERHEIVRIEILRAFKALLPCPLPVEDVCQAIANGMDRSTGSISQNIAVDILLGLISSYPGEVKLLPTFARFINDSFGHVKKMGSSNLVFMQPSDIHEIVSLETNSSLVVGAVEYQIQALSVIRATVRGLQTKQRKAMMGSLQDEWNQCRHIFSDDGQKWGQSPRLGGQGLDVETFIDVIISKCFSGAGSSNKVKPVVFTCLGELVGYLRPIYTFEVPTDETYIRAGTTLSAKNGFVVIALTRHPSAASCVQRIIPLIDKVLSFPPKDSGKHFLLRDSEWELRQAALGCLATIILHIPEGASSEVIFEHLNEVTNLDTAHANVVQSRRVILRHILSITSSPMTGLMGSEHRPVIGALQASVRARNAATLGIERGILKNHRETVETACKIIQILYRRMPQAFSVQETKCVTEFALACSSSGSLHGLADVLNLLVLFGADNPELIDFSCLANIFGIPAVSGTPAHISLVRLFKVIAYPGGFRELWKAIRSGVHPATATVATECFATNVLEAGAVGDALQCLHEELSPLSLLAIGKIGQALRMSGSELTDQLAQWLWGLIQSKESSNTGETGEELRLAASQALGEGAGKQFLLRLAVEHSGDTHALTALRRYFNTVPWAHLSPVEREQWHCAILSGSEALDETGLNLASECLGLLVQHYPEDAVKFVDTLVEGLQPGVSPARKALLISTLKFAFTPHDQPLTLEQILRSKTVDSATIPSPVTIADSSVLPAAKPRRLQSFSDGDIRRLLPLLAMSMNEPRNLRVRKVALTSINLAAKMHPELVRERLNDSIVPGLLPETVLQAEFVTVIEMGPFKHRVDEGLETRKAAYELIGTLLEMGLPELEVERQECVAARVVAGLKDEIQIRIMCCGMLPMMPSHLIEGKQGDIAASLEKMMFSKAKEKAVQQEVDKQTELVRVGVSTTLRLDEMLVQKREEWLKLVKDMRALTDKKSSLLPSGRQSK